MPRKYVLSTAISFARVLWRNTVCTLACHSLQLHRHQRRRLRSQTTAHNEPGEALPETPKVPEAANLALEASGSGLASKRSIVYMRMTLDRCWWGCL
ncbi:hypothetical protein EI94DRAFT_1749711 [Lactarius quietus]|nr:hypothetical protein EI94DRAFT_1749711 [Lactarius quietus]